MTGATGPFASVPTASASAPNTNARSRRTSVARRLERAIPPQHGGGDREVEQRVHDREPSDDGLHQARRQHDRGDHAGALAGDARRRVPDRAAHRDRRERRGQAQRERASRRTLSRTARRSRSRAAAARTTAAALRCITTQSCVSRISRATSPYAVSLLSQSVPMPRPGRVTSAARSAPRSAARAGTDRICWKIGLVYPVALSVRGRRVVVVGGGAVAERKVRGLLGAEPDVVVVSPALTPPLAALAEVGAIRWEPRRVCAGRPCRRLHRVRSDRRRRDQRGDRGRRARGRHPRERRFERRAGRLRDAGRPPVRPADGQRRLGRACRRRSPSASATSSRCSSMRATPAPRRRWAHCASAFTPSFRPSSAPR